MFGSPSSPPPAPIPPQAPAPPPMFGETGRTPTRKPRKPGEGMQPTILGTGQGNPTNTGTATLLGGA